MKIIRLLVVPILLCGVVLWQGCALFLVGAAAGAAAGGTVSYIGNELRTTQEVSIDKAWTAAQGAVSELGFMIDSAKSHKDGTGAVLYSHNAQEQRVLIVLKRESDRLTEIRVTVGIFDTDANRRAAQLVYDKMHSRM
jgi:hypothetical protein